MVLNLIRESDVTLGGDWGDTLAGRREWPDLGALAAAVDAPVSSTHQALGCSDLLPSMQRH